MKTNQDGMLPILNKAYAVTYKNEYDQVGMLEGMLVHADLNGFTVFNVDNKRVIIPKDRIFILRETEMQGAVETPQDKQHQADTGDKLGS